MNTQKTAFFTVMLIGLGMVLFGWLSSGSAGQTSAREYEVVVPAAKSDTQRIIEAYERLSDQYLSLVQNQLTLMAANNRDILTRLERMEKKLDDLSAKIDAIQKPAAPIPLKPAAPSPLSQPLPQASPPAQNVPAGAK
jgi:hypothetical protein